MENQNAAPSLSHTKPGKTKMELLMEKKAKLERIIRSEKAKESKEERKKRTHELIQRGALLDIVGLGNVDKGVLLGGFLEMAKTLNETPNKVESWKTQGDMVLKERETAKREGIK